MTAPFDPYHKWLGIPPKDQPPHHYRLLGIELFEDDADVIESAANRLMTYLHDVAAGDATGQSQKLLNEISAARICLLNKQRKSTYDAQLKDTLRKGQVAERARTQPPPAHAPVEIPRTVPTLRKWAWLGVLVALGLGVLGIIAVLGRSAFWGEPPLADRAPADRVGNRLEQDNSTPDLAKQPRAALILDWPPAQRLDATLHINGAPQDIPATAGIEVPLDAGPLQLSMERPGYVDILWDCVVARGERVRYSPVWEPIDNGISVQDKATTTGGTSKRTGSGAQGRPNDRSVPGSEEEIPGERAATLPEFPLHLSVPASDAQSALDWTELLQFAPQEDLIALRLIGGEAVLNSAAFQLTPRSPVGDRRSWVAHYVDRQEKRVDIAQFELDGQCLRFRWAPDRDPRQMDQLRNALLEIKTGLRYATLPLRPATIVQPLVLAGPKGVRKIEVRVDTLPEISKLRLKLTHSDGHASFVRRFADKIAGPGEKVTVDVGAGESDFPLEVHVAFEAPRAGARVICIEYELRYRSHSQPLQNWSRNNISRDLALAKRTHQQRVGVTSQKQRDQMLRIVDYYTQLDVLAQSTNSLVLHYQVLLPIEETQVVLATSAGPE